MYSYSIKIPIRPHFKKLIAKHVDTSPLVLTFGKCHYSAIFYNSLERSSFPQNNFKDHKQLVDKIEIEIPASIAKENRFYIDPKRVSYIDAQLRSIFDEKLFEHLNFNANGKGEIKAQVLKFMDYYGITEEDITFDALIKSYQRYRKATGEKADVNFRTKATTHNPPKVNTAQTQMFI